MDAISMLHPDGRCVRSKMALFLRLWMARYRYEQMRPHGSTSAERLRFHLVQLRSCWRRVVAFQKALGLEMVPFVPQEQFETIYVVSAYVQRELDSPCNTVIDIADLWRDYVQQLNSLSHEGNPFDFGETCQGCHKIINQLNGRFEPKAKIIRLNQAELDDVDDSSAVLL